MAGQEIPSHGQRPNTWQREDPPWNVWTAPNIWNNYQQSPDMTYGEFQNNGLRDGFFNFPYNSLMAPNQMPQPNSHMNRNQQPYSWNQKFPNSNRNWKNNNNRMLKPNLSKSHKILSNNNKKILSKTMKIIPSKKSPIQPSKLAEKYKSIETSSEVSQKKSDISQLEKERLRKVEEEKQRISMALTKKNNVASLDFKSCLSPPPKVGKTKGSNKLELSCLSTPKITLTESDFREIGLMNERKESENREEFTDENSQMSPTKELIDEDSQRSPSRELIEEDSHSSSSDDSIFEYPVVYETIDLVNEKEGQNIEVEKQCLMPTGNSIGSIKIEKGTIDAETIESSNSISSSATSNICHDRTMPETAITTNEELSQVFNDNDPKKSCDVGIGNKSNREKSGGDEIVIGFIDRDENLHSVKKIENRLKEIDNFSKVKSMYGKFLRYRRFAKTDVSLYDKLKSKHSKHLENPLLNQENLDRLMKGDDDEKKGNREVIITNTVEEGNSNEEVDEFMAIFGDLLDENCSIPEDTLYRLGLGSLIFEGEEKSDVLTDPSSEIENNPLGRDSLNDQHPENENCHPNEDFDANVSSNIENNPLQRDFVNKDPGNDNYHPNEDFTNKISETRSTSENSSVSLAHTVKSTDEKVGDENVTSTQRTDSKQQPVLLDVIQSEECVEPHNDSDQLSGNAACTKHRSEISMSDDDNSISHQIFPNPNIHENPIEILQTLSKPPSADLPYDPGSSITRRNETSHKINHKGESHTCSTNDMRSTIENMKVRDYIQLKISCASVLEKDPFEVAKTVICSYAQDLLALKGISPYFEKEYGTIVKLLRNLKQPDEKCEENLKSIQTSISQKKIPMKNEKNDPVKRKYDHVLDSDSRNADEYHDNLQRVKKAKNVNTSQNAALEIETEDSHGDTLKCSPDSEIYISDKETSDEYSDSDSDVEYCGVVDENHMASPHHASIIRNGLKNVELNIDDRIHSAIGFYSSSPNSPKMITSLKVFKEELFLGCSDGKVIRMMQNRKQQRCLMSTDHSDSITSIGGFRSFLLSGSSDGTVRVTYLIHPYVTFHSYNLEEEVSCLEIMWGTLFVGTHQGSVFRCNLKNFSKKAEKIIVGNSNMSPVYDIKASREGPRNILIISARAKPLTIRDAKNGLLLHTLDVVDVVYSFAHNTSSPFVYCGTRHKSVVALDIVRNIVVDKLQLGLYLQKVILRSNLLYTAAYKGTVNVYSLKEKKTLYTIVSPTPIKDMAVWCNHIVITTVDRTVLTFSLPKHLSTEPIRRNTIRSKSNKIEDSISLID